MSFYYFFVSEKAEEMRRNLYFYIETMLWGHEFTVMQTHFEKGRIKR